ncbi:MAG: succinylglutamate desuccinylase/aspartoacylase family protein [Hydrogenovibrio sp.]|uniref:succinylglutamate desuccinylase/aspartoacylase family protein n=1 Tax=Hydrogenovibrio sp. TaxID=2065821 RepID=UPI00287063EF|nr:succinylglutamate desuccinylase/aspartoacylase family protein [Hydrogenovibrio sp.]MDR9499762.1 succinylglutamate desuccinylase/aspartoacylase family protein [Hydrogenovibrio sp.]
MPVSKNTPFQIGGVNVAPGERQTVDLKMGKLYTHTDLNMPVQVINGRQKGPVLLVSAAIHGDELNGVEIIRRLLQVKSLKRLKGTLVAVPIVNLYGFINQSRYLPDRRDLNRSFPGSPKGSLAGRMAHFFLQEVVCQCTHGIDLHTGAINRTNLPQIRADLDDPETLALAEAFGAPLMMNMPQRDGSLRSAAVKNGIPILLYEAGEALRFDEMSIRAGVRGILNVMKSLGMITPQRRKKPSHPPVVARSSSWVRAPQSGIFRALVKDGERVQKGVTLIGVVSDPFGEDQAEIVSPYTGIVIGQMMSPLVNEGEALFHIARFARSDLAEAHVERFADDIQTDEQLPYDTDDIPDFP